MKAFLSVSMALMLAGALGIAYAAKHEMPKDNAVTAACKEKKAGDEVVIDGKKIKCPDMKGADKPKGTDKPKSSY